MNFSQNSDYSLISDSEAASIVCRYTPEMIIDTIEGVIQNKYREYSFTLANIVESMELSYKMSMAQLPEYSPELMSQRHDSYLQIISLICNAHQLACRFDDTTDVYTVATNVYDLLISRFNIHIMDFFVNFINREKSMIYDTLDLATKRKDTPAYSKKIYKNSNSKLATIHANLEFVLENVCAYDIDFEKFIELAYLTNKPMGRFLLSILTDNGDFFKRIIVPYYKNNYAVLTTHTKLALQGLATVELDDLV